MTYSAEDKLRCIRRELKYRTHVFPRRVEQGNMTPEDMRHELAVMQAIVEDYERLAQRERLL